MPLLPSLLAPSRQTLERGNLGSSCPYDRTVPKAAPGITPSSPRTCLSARRLMHLLPVSINWRPLFVLPIASHGILPETA